MLSEALGSQCLSTLQGRRIQDGRSSARGEEASPQAGLLLPPGSSLLAVDAALSWWLTWCSSLTLYSPEMFPL